MRPRSKEIGEIAQQGFPASLNMMTVALGIFIITYFIAMFGKAGVAAYGIATRVEQIILMPTIGLNIAALSIIGQNNGAGKLQRIKETIKRSMIYGGVILTIGAVLLFFFGGMMMRVFTDDPEVLKIGSEYLKIAAFITYAYLIMHLFISALQGMKKPMFALWMGLYRQIAAPIPLFYLTSVIFGLGLYGLWWSIFAVTWSGALFTLFYGRWYIRKLTQSTSESS